ncbi:MAG TPA: TadE/TadG family type IV pilus assembly protein [Candidatus Limnocylindrales bacterium]|nr:TadE/TadG family type IV pilus assembly protein [Candidatus Limnocylindrales bacterium]
MSVRNDDAQAIVEFALVLPVLLAAAFAIVLVSELGVARLALQHATAEGARAGALTNEDAQIRNTLAAAVTPLPADRIATEIIPAEDEPPRNSDPRGSVLTVRASYELPIPFSLIGFPKIVVHASSARRVEWTP